MTTGNILATSRRIPQDLCGPSQPFRPEHKTRRFKPLPTHPPPSTQSLLLPCPACPALTVPCPVLSCPALPCQRQRTRASHSDPRVPRVGHSQGSELAHCCLFFVSLSVGTLCQNPLALPPAGRPRSKVESSRARSGIYGVSPWCAISSLIRTSSPVSCRLGQGLLLGLTDLQTNITCRADCLPAVIPSRRPPPVPPTWPTPMLLPTFSHKSAANEQTAPCL